MNYILPYITYNAITYSIATISATITTSTNVFNFIIEHKDNEYIIFQRQLESTDLNNKLCITYSLIKDIIKHHCKTISVTENIDKNINDFIDESLDPGSSCISTPTPISNVSDEEFNMIELIEKRSSEINVPEPVKISLLSTMDVINKLNSILEIVKQKIVAHQQSYLKSFVGIKINDEIKRIISLTNIFNSRLHILFEILKIYKDNIII